MHSVFWFRVGIRSSRQTEWRRADVEHLPSIVARSRHTFAGTAEQESHQESDAIILENEITGIVAEDVLPRIGQTRFNRWKRAASPRIWFSRGQDSLLSLRPANNGKKNDLIWSSELSYFVPLRRTMAAAGLSRDRKKDNFN